MIDTREMPSVAFAASLFVVEVAVEGLVRSGSGRGKPALCSRSTHEREDSMRPAISKTFGGLSAPHRSGWRTCTSTTVSIELTSVQVHYRQVLIVVIAGESRGKGCIDHWGPFSAVRNPVEMGLFCCPRANLGVPIQQIF